MGQRSTTFGIRDILVALVMDTFPRLSRWIGLQFFDASQTEFYRSLVHDTMAHRQKENIFRPDMIQLLMEAKTKGSIRMDAAADASSSESYATVQDISPEQLQGKARIWSDADLTAQCFLFFTAGFETTATLLATMCHELAENQQVQLKLRQEIDDARAGLNGAPFTYDVMQSLKYLDMVVSESLRKWPPAIATDRMCVRPYELTDDDGHTLRIQKGDGLWIPIFALHRDPEYWPEPSKFDPERFSDGRKAEIQPFTYVPFGVGPRNCIGKMNRFRRWNPNLIDLYIICFRISFCSYVGENFHVQFDVEFYVGDARHHSSSFATVSSWLSSFGRKRIQY